MSPGLPEPFFPTTSPDPRMALAQQTEQGMKLLYPATWSGVHEITTTGPEETTFALASSFLHAQDPQAYHIPSFSRAINSCTDDMKARRRGAYTQLKQTLQLVQWQRNKANVNAMHGRHALCSSLCSVYLILNF